MSIGFNKSFGWTPLNIVRSGGSVLTGAIQYLAIDKNGDLIDKVGDLSLPEYGDTNILTYSGIGKIDVDHSYSNMEITHDGTATLVMHYGYISITSAGTVSHIKLDGVLTYPCEEGYGGSLLNIVNRAHLGALDLSECERTTSDTIESYTRTVGCNTMDSAFKMTWVAGAGDTITIPTESGYTFNGTIDWGDGTEVQTFTVYNDANLSHEYVSSGYYQTTIEGEFGGIDFYNNSAMCDKVKSLDSLGLVDWHYLTYAFRNANLQRINIDFFEANVTIITGIFRDNEHLDSVVMNNLVLPDASAYMFYHSTITDRIEMRNLNLNGNSLRYAFRSIDGYPDIDLEGMVFNGGNIQSSFISGEYHNINMRGWEPGTNTTPFTSMMDVGTDVTGTIDVSNWDLSDCTSLAGACYFFRPEHLVGLDTWDVSNILTFGSLFYNSIMNTELLLDIKDWDVSNVGSLYNTFCSSDVTDLSSLVNWDVSSVTIIASLLQNTDITTVDPLSGWDVSSVEDISSTFRNCHKLNNIDALSNWTMLNLTEMRYAFAYCELLTDISPLYNWDTSKVANMGNLFRNSVVLTTADLSNWDTTSLTTTEFMFTGCSSLTDVNISGWDLSKLTDSNYWFGDCGNTLSVNVTDCSIGTKLDDMFHNSKCEVVGLDTWDVSAVTDMSNFLTHNNLFTNISDLSEWDVSSVTNFEYMFNYSGITSVDDLSEWDIDSCTNIKSMLNATDITNVDGLSEWNVSSVEHINALFYNCSDLTDISGLSAWDIGSTDDLSSLLHGTSITSVDAISGWNTSNITNMYSLFRDTNIPNVDSLSGWDFSKVGITSYMFFNCKDLTSLDLTYLTSMPVLSNMARMFEGTEATTEINLSGMDVSHATNLTYMFNTAESPSFILDDWVFNASANVDYMFDDAVGAVSIKNATFNTPDLEKMMRGYQGTSIDMSNCDVSGVTNMRYMFYVNHNLTTLDVTGWNIDNVTNFSSFLYHSTLTTSSYSDLLVQFASGTPNTGLAFHGGSSKYNAAGETARNTLSTTYGWTFTDGGLE